MTKNKKLPKHIHIDDIEIVKISVKKDNGKLAELLNVYNANREHLHFWHHEWDELIFKSIEEIKNHLIKHKLICYVIYQDKKIIGCIEVGKLSAYKEDEKRITSRTLTYWIDKNYVRKGITFKCLEAFERLFIEHGVLFIRTEVDVDNKPSNNLMKKIGYKLSSVSFYVSENGETMCEFYTFFKDLA